MGDVSSVSVMEQAAAEKLIVECLEVVVRPQVQLHGGNIQFVSYQESIVTVKLEGACHGCPVSFYTLKMGVLEELKKVIPTIRDVVAL